MEEAIMYGGAVALLGVFCLVALVAGGLAVHCVRDLQRAWKQTRDMGDE